MTDRYLTLTALAVLLVAAIAAVIGYQHVVALALRHGQPVLAAYLLLVSIDGVAAVSSLVDAAGCPARRRGNRGSPAPGSS